MIDKMLVVKLRDDVKLPERAEGNAGYDLFCPDEIVCKANSITKINTGLAIRPPINIPCAIVAWDKSSVAAGNINFAGGVETVAGLFDASYQGEYIIAIWNNNDFDVTFKKGQKFVQLVVLPILTPDIISVSSIKEFDTDFYGRGEGGFGSTGDGTA
jgi:dUTP pyrophosphatase